MARPIAFIVFGTWLIWLTVAIATARRDAHDAALMTLRIGMQVKRARLLAMIQTRPQQYAQWCDALLTVWPQTRADWQTLAPLQAALHDDHPSLMLRLSTPDGEPQALVTAHVLAVYAAPRQLTVLDPAATLLQLTIPPTPKTAMAQYITIEDRIFLMATRRLSCGWLDVLQDVQLIVSEIEQYTGLAMNVYDEQGKWQFGSLPAADHSPIAAHTWQATGAWGMLLRRVTVNGQAYLTGSTPIAHGKAGVSAMFAPIAATPQRWQQTGILLMLIGGIGYGLIRWYLRRAVRPFVQGFEAITTAALSEPPVAVGDLALPEFHTAILTVVRVIRAANERVQAAQQAAQTAQERATIAEAELGYALSLLRYLREGVVLLNRKEILLANPAARCALDRDDVQSGMPVSVVGGVVRQVCDAAWQANTTVTQRLSASRGELLCSVTPIVWQDAPALLVLFCCPSADPCPQHLE